MPDVLQTLMSLPPEAATWSEADNVGLIIRRGAMGSEASILLATKNDVDRFNAEHGVTPEQLRAMEVGCTLGWDADGACLRADAKTYVYTAPFVLLISVQADTEEQAAIKAQAVANAVDTTNLPAGAVSMYRDGDWLDLSETS